MFNEEQEKYLLRLLSRNEVVLFLGAGFSTLAKNRLGQNLPTGGTFAGALYKFLGYPGEYDGTPLPQMFQAFITKGVSEENKITFLSDHLQAHEVPELYANVAIPYWYKIYTTNVDNVLERAFVKAGRKGHVLSHPKDEYGERDASLLSTLLIYLHGKLPCSPTELVFSTRQYSRASLVHHPLYGQFVYDYSCKPTLFVGSELSEPLFEQYIESREMRGQGSEPRPKSFLIVPSVSPVKKDLLEKSYNIEHVSGTTTDFLQWLGSIQSKLASRSEILKITLPGFASFVGARQLSLQEQSEVAQYTEAFKRVPTEYAPKHHRSNFLMGASPTWHDIFLGHDIPRNVTNRILKHVEGHLKEANPQVRIVSITGSAGSGKSTILKRLGLRVSQAGYTTFLSYSDFLPSLTAIRDVLANLGERVVLMFDNADNVLGLLPELIKYLAELQHPPLVVLSFRLNYADRINGKLGPIIDMEEFIVPDLEDRHEIEMLIKKLEENNLLGVLQGMNRVQRIEAFEQRAKKQLLVAMREATQGKSFDEIIKDEFSKIEPLAAKEICVGIALCSEHGYTNTRQDVVGFSPLPPAESLHHLGRTLRGTIIEVGPLGNEFMLRHKTLAEYILDNCVGAEMLKSVYINVLSVLAPELLHRSRGVNRKFSLYSRIINHEKIYKRFRKDIECARAIFESVASFFRQDYQFWLQYGALESEGAGGNFELAENYLQQALSLSPNNMMVLNALCNLYYKIAEAEKDQQEAIEYRAEANKVMVDLIKEAGATNSYVYNIYCIGNYHYVKRWIGNREERKKELHALLKVGESGLKNHPRNRRLQELVERIRRSYLNLGVSDIFEELEREGGNEL